MKTMMLEGGGQSPSCLGAALNGAEVVLGVGAHAEAKAGEVMCWQQRQGQPVQLVLIGCGTDS
jgi:hypothetical protein